MKKYNAPALMGFIALLIMALGFYLTHKHPYPTALAIGKYIICWVAIIYFCLRFFFKESVRSLLVGIGFFIFQFFLLNAWISGTMLIITGISALFMAGLFAANAKMQTSY